MNAFLNRLRGGELVLMLAIRSSRTAGVVRIAKSTGYHAVMVDLEHSTMPLDVAAALCATAGDLGLFPFVRVREREYGALGPLLDCGAQGIIAPRVETAAEAATVARACRFAPRGQRSQLGTVPQAGMRPTPAATLNPVLNDATVVQILIETPAGVANAEEIAAVDGVDMLGFGANDFTAELGVPGEYDDPRVTEAIAALGAAGARHGKPLMVGGIPDPALLGRLAPLGVCPLRLTGTDTDMLYGRGRVSAPVGTPPGGRKRPGELTVASDQTSCGAPPMRAAESSRPVAVPSPPAGCVRRSLPRVRARLPARPRPALHVPRRDHRPVPGDDRGARHRADGSRPAHLLRHRQPPACRRAQAARAALRRRGPHCARVTEDTTDAELDAFHEIGVRAIRLDLFARAGWPAGKLIAYIRRMAARATPRGWHLQFYTPGTVVRDLLPFLADLEDTFVIDHMGYLTEPDPQFEARLLGLLTQGSCWIKLSGAYRVAKHKPLSSVSPWARALVATRPDRLIWGSDWPHLPDGQRDTGEILNVLADWAPAEQARQSILVDGPTRLFFS